MIHTRTIQVVGLLVVRGSLAASLSPLLDTSPCGPELEATAREAVESFVQIETLIDQTGARLTDQLSVPGLFASRVMIVSDVEVVEPSRLTRQPLPASVAGAVLDVERELLRQLRTMSMAVAHAAHGSLRDLGLAIEAAAPGEGRTRATDLHAALVQLAVSAGMDRDARHPFQALWPRVRASVVAVERPRVVPAPARPWLQRVNVVTEETSPPVDLCAVESSTATASEQAVLVSAEAASGSVGDALPTFANDSELNKTASRPLSSL